MSVYRVTEVIGVSDESWRRRRALPTWPVFTVTGCVPGRQLQHLLSGKHVTL
jgi:hypothetical protein